VKNILSPSFSKIRPHPKHEIWKITSSGVYIIMVPICKWVLQNYLVGERVLQAGEEQDRNQSVTGWGAPMD
jgi:hypothetical protein